MWQWWIKDQLSTSYKCKTTNTITLQTMHCKKALFTKWGLLFSSVIYYNTFTNSTQEKAIHKYNEHTGGVFSLWNTSILLQQLKIKQLYKKLQYFLYYIQNQRYKPFMLNYMYFFIERLALQKACLPQRVFFCL